MRRKSCIQVSNENFVLLSSFVLLFLWLFGGWLVGWMGTVWNDKFNKSHHCSVSTILKHFLIWFFSWIKGIKKKNVAKDVATFVFFVDIFCCWIRYLLWSTCFSHGWLLVTNWWLLISLQSCCNSLCNHLLVYTETLNRQIIDDVSSSVNTLFTSFDSC